MPPELREQTTLVFKHFPLENHSWARPAATLAACTADQSPTAFWELTDYLLGHQAEVRQGNIKTRAFDLLSTRREINLRQLETCASGEAGVALIARDEAIAKQLAIHSTPTLFINGRRVVPLESQNQLEQLLARELHSETALVHTQAKQ